MQGKIQKQKFSWLSISSKTTPFLRDRALNFTNGNGLLPMELLKLTENQKVD
jgi:hypothetical protein